MSKSVKIPTSPDEAALMVLLGTNYLRKHAPERLTPLERRAACAEQLATACIEYFGPLTHHALCSSRQGKGCDCYSSRKVKVYAALAKFEATKESK